MPQRQRPLGGGGVASKPEELPPPPPRPHGGLGCGWLPQHEDQGLPYSFVGPPAPPPHDAPAPPCPPPRRPVSRAIVPQQKPLTEQWAFAAPIGLSPLLILTLCGPERVLVVSTEPPDDLSCLTTPGVGCPGDGAVARAVDQGHPDRGGAGGASRCRKRLPVLYAPCGRGTQQPGPVPTNTRKCRGPCSPAGSRLEPKKGKGSIGLRSGGTSGRTCFW